MKKVTRTTLGITMLALIGIYISSYSKNNSYPSPQVNVNQIKLQQNATLGKILVDKDGRTLYSFADDANGENTCTGGCETIWPPFYVDNLTADQLGDAASEGDRFFSYYNILKQETAYL